MNVYFIKQFDELDKLITLFLTNNKNKTIKAQIYVLLNKLMSQSVFLRASGSIDLSLIIMQKLLESSKKIKDVDLECKTLYGICELYRTKNELDQCKKYCEKALELAKKENISEIESSALNNLGLYHHELGYCDEAIRLFKEAIEISKDNNLIQDLLLQMSNLGRTYTFTGKYRIAEDYFNLAIKFAKKYNLLYEEINVNNELLILYMRIGRLEDALNLAKKNLQFGKRSGNKIIEKASYNNLGSIFRKKGQYQKAIDNHQLSLKLDESIGDKKGMASSLNNLAVVYSNWKKFYLSLEYFLRALDLVREIGDIFGINNVLLNIASILMRDDIQINELKKIGIDNPKETALEYINEVKINSIKINDQDNLIKALLLEYYFIENIEEKEEIISTAYDFAKELNNYEILMSCLIVKANLLLEKNENKEALKEIKEAKKIAIDIGDMTSESIILVKIGRIFANLGKYESSFENFVKAIEILELQTGELIVEDYRIIFRESIIDVYSSIIEVLIKLYQKERNEIHLYNIIKYMELIKSREIIDKIENSEISTSTIYPEIENLLIKEKELCRKINSTREQVIIQKYSKKNDKDIDFDVLVEMDKELREIRLEIQNKYPKPGLIRISTEFNPELYLNKLFEKKEDCVLWYIVISHENLNSLLITKESIKLISTEIINFSSLIEILNEYNFNNEIKQKEEILKKLSAELGEIIPNEIKSIIKQKALLIVVPWGLLHSIPWSITRINEKKYLGLEIQISYVNSLTLLNSFLTKEIIKDQSRVLIIKNPTLDLPGSNVEVKKIVELFKSKIDSNDKLSIIEKEEATIPVFNEKLKENYDIIHFAGHAEFNPFNPWLSHLKFFDKGSFAPLTVTEMQNYKFINNPLFILSGCETGRERVKSGDETFGIKRGLFLAGVTSILATNWILLDEVGPFFMTYFYQSIIKGDSVTKALLNARRNLYKKEGMTNYVDWGVFDIYGDPFRKFNFG